MTASPAPVPPADDAPRPLPRWEATRVLPPLLAVVFAVVVLRAAWMGDDARITLRVVANVLEGYGPVWNVTERVQVFTHPLWFLLLTAAVGGWTDFHLAPLALSLLCTAGAFGLLVFRGPASRVHAALAAVACLFSKAFVDYSTSGLENPLTHLLLAGALLNVLGTPLPGGPDRRLLHLGWLSGLLVLNRLDAALLAGPLLLAGMLQPGVRWRARLAAAGLAAGLPLLWMAFSVVYYGFPFPNTYYAKLGPEMRGGAVYFQGVLYFLDSLGRDPVTLPVIALGVAAGLRRGAALAERAVAAAILLYLLYVLRIGGDFMSGRFFTAPFVLAVGLLARVPVELSGWAPRLLASALVLAGSASDTPPHMTPQTVTRRPAVIPNNGVTDERHFYFADLGLMNRRRDPRYPDAHFEQWQNPRPSVYIMPMIGVSGFFGGPKIHVIDFLGLGDPFLSRLPAADVEDWRIGHRERLIPDGYAETILFRENRLRDPFLAQFYDDIALITRGPLWAPERWEAIRRANTGGLDFLLDRAALSQRSALQSLEQYRLKPSVHQHYWQVAHPPGRDDEYLYPEYIGLAGSRYFIHLPRPARAACLEISVEPENTLLVEFLREGVKLGELVVPDPAVKITEDPARIPEDPGIELRLHTLTLPAAVATRGTDCIVLRPIRSKGSAWVGHVRLLPDDRQ